MDQTIPGIVQNSEPSYFVDLVILLALLGGYGFMSLKQYWLPKLNRPAVDSNRRWWQRLWTESAANTHPLSPHDRQSIRRCLPIFLSALLLYSVALGFITSSYGLVAMLWIWVATVAGMLIRHFGDKRLAEQDQKR